MGRRPTARKNPLLAIALLAPAGVAGTAAFIANLDTITKSIKSIYVSVFNPDSIDCRVRASEIASLEATLKNFDDLIVEGERISDAARALGQGTDYSLLRQADDWVNRADQQLVNYGGKSKRDLPPPLEGPMLGTASGPLPSEKKKGFAQAQRVVAVNSDLRAGKAQMVVQISAAKANACGPAAD